MKEFFIALFASLLGVYRSYSQKTQKEIDSTPTPYDALLSSLIESYKKELLPYFINKEACDESITPTIAFNIRTEYGLKLIEPGFYCQKKLSECNLSFQVFYECVKKYLLTHYGITETDDAILELRKQIQNEVKPEAQKIVQEHVKQLIGVGNDS